MPAKLAFNQHFMPFLPELSGTQITKVPKMPTLIIAQRSGCLFLCIS